MIESAGFVTAGGASSRMGRDKAWLEIDGQTMIERVIAALRPVTSSVSIIANRREYDRLGLPVFADENVGIGPLEAIRVALANTNAPRIVLAGCDMPFVTPELFRYLLDLSGPYQAVIPLSADGRLEPLCAVYAMSALATVAELIAGGARKVSLLFEQISTRYVAFDEMRHLRGADLFFENVNTELEYARAVERLNPVEKFVELGGKLRKNRKNILP
jgi:molybdopterin-guanine dinucleotide biosynthesis protein A